MRPVMEAAYQDLSNGLVPIVVAPTGYGKTRASPEIWRLALQDGIAGGLVHVAPLRSLVRKIYEDVFKEYGGAYQMHDPTPGPDKSPYLLRDLVVTTLDSFTLNLYRLPVVESLKIEAGLSLGHYYPVYTSVLSSVIVFDEAHLYLDEGAQGQGIIVETLKALTKFLAASGANLIIETATMKPSTLKTIAEDIRRSGRKPIVRTLACPNASQYQNTLKDALSTVARVEPVEDPEWLSGRSGVSWETLLLEDWDDAIPLIRELAENGRVLVVANTVREAVRLHNIMGGVLIHGRLTNKDREKAENALVGDEPGIVVATQVIEAGVDVNSIAVFTEAAPIESIVQRAGRACRRGAPLQWCKENKGLLAIVGGSPDRGVYEPKEVAVTLEVIADKIQVGRDTIDWRLPCPGMGRDSYSSLIVEVDSSLPPTTGRPSQTITDLLYYYLWLDGVHDFLRILETWQGWCGLVRNTLMMPILVGDDYVIVSLQWALAHAVKILETDSDGAPVLVGVELAGGGLIEGPASKAWENYRRYKVATDRNCFWLLSSLKRDMERIARASGRGVALYRWAFKAKPGVYVDGKGFIVDLPGGGGGRE